MLFGKKPLASAADIEPLLNQARELAKKLGAELEYLKAVRIDPSDPATDSTIAFLAARGDHLTDKLEGWSKDVQALAKRVRIKGSENDAELKKAEDTLRYLNDLLYAEARKIGRLRQESLF